MYMIRYHQRMCLVIQGTNWCTNQLMGHRPIRQGSFQERHILYQFRMLSHYTPEHIDGVHHLVQNSLQDMWGYINDIHLGFGLQKYLPDKPQYRLCTHPQYRRTRVDFRDIVLHILHSLYCCHPSQALYNFLHISYQVGLKDHLYICLWNNYRHRLQHPDQKRYKDRLDIYQRIFSSKILCKEQICSDYNVKHTYYRSQHQHRDLGIDKLSRIQGYRGRQNNPLSIQSNNDVFDHQHMYHQDKSLCILCRRQWNIDQNYKFPLERTYA